MSGSPHDPPLHELEPTTRFSDRADDYVRYRPDYPAAAIDRMLDGLVPRALPGHGRTPRTMAADVGAGTGISARLLADRGVRVLAIEPNASMREAAVAHPLVTWWDGEAEATGLPDACVDLVLAAQAFHWFRAEDAIVEFHRILVPRGRLAIVWNDRDDDDPFTRGYIEAIHAVYGEHPAERRPFDPSVVSAGDRFTAPELAVFPHEQRLDREGLIGRARSSSYVPKGEGFDELARLLSERFDRYRGPDGLAALRYRTEVWTAESR